MTTTLITGANRGLGLETARRLVAAGHTVYLGARDERRGREAAERLGDAARPLRIDVTSDDSVKAAADRVAEEAGRLDVLVNNAGIAGPYGEAGDLTADDLRAVYDTNVLGAVRVLNAFLPLLRAARAPVVVNVSSGLGSLGMNADPEGHTDLLPVYVPALAYNSSKAALNMLTLLYARACPGIRVNAVDPGYTATDLNGHSGLQSVEEGAEVIVRMAMTGPDGPTGGFFGNHGPLPW
ncbi:SDR family oxidoreductase [Streptomyces griseocarneus]|uniref:SDR family oxidoreductase n=1 Tax=Streptomyces griseocarneus TaxID=51201 RepID=UPI00167CDD6A|nr:SDR family oxidoreductase [Streptomyces griseocarneus]MBZ6477614.1 SDR family oxidoreductase [Streptomyces griseocarneus]GHG83295.1 short-chain dehydrogenase [Streptomyces griseocarneus]